MTGLKLKEWSGRMKIELRVLYYASHHPQVKWYSKLLVFLTVAYALSPLDLIPDFIPVVGLIDDLVIVPFGIFLALKTIPKEVLAECREQAKQPVDDPRLRRPGLLLVVAVWAAAIGLILCAVLR